MDKPMDAWQSQNLTIANAIFWPHLWQHNSLRNGTGRTHQIYGGLGTLSPRWCSVVMCALSFSLWASTSGYSVSLHTSHWIKVVGRETVAINCNQCRVVATTTLLPSLTFLALSCVPQSHDTISSTRDQKTCSNNEINFYPVHVLTWARWREG